MAKLIYVAITSLDGFVEDRNGSFEWAAPDHEVHEFINERIRPVGTYLYGRRMYETMAYWETHGADDGDSDVEHDFAAIWRAANKIVYSRALSGPSSSRTIIERDFNEPVIRQLKQSSRQDISIGGAELASQALRAGLVDEVQLTLMPVLVGEGKAAICSDEPVRLELLEERRFVNGALFVRYAVAK